MCEYNDLYLQVPGVLYRCTVYYSQVCEYKDLYLQVPGVLCIGANSVSIIYLYTGTWCTVQVPGLLCPVVQCVSIWTCINIQQVSGVLFRYLVY